MKHVNKIFPIGLCFLLTGCGDNPFKDNDPIKDTDYSIIRIEIERCNHIAKEGSFTATLRWSPRTDCLKHLDKRIVRTGKALNVLNEAAS